MTSTGETNEAAPPASDATAEVWTDWCVKRLDAYAAEFTRDPSANSVRRLAFDLSILLEEGRVNLAQLGRLAKALSDEAFILRAERFAASHPPVDAAALKDAVGGALDAASAGAFDDFRRATEETRAGVVFTAHPTFALSRELRRTLAAYAGASDDKARTKQKTALATLRHAPDDRISLFDEHDDAIEAIENAQASIAAVNREILLHAKKRFPKDWTRLTPAPISLATWVGYDLDGRTDIHWGQTVRIRLEEKARQLDRYAQALEAISKREALPGAAQLAGALKGAGEFAAEQAALFAGDLDDPDVVVKAANYLTAKDPRRLVSLDDAREALSAMIAAAKDEETQLLLCGLRADMKAYGLSVARIHLRVNAAQVRSALRADFGLDDDAAFMGRTALDEAAKRTEAAARRNVNFASVFLEQMTARRQFMLCAEILKHIDADTPIRFLIAECEAPATVMGAIYLARLYGVEDRLDVSPLFETPEAIERGGRFLERLLDEDAFVDYIRRRGRIAIQLGFSDSGRFMGQVAASLAIERLHILLARALGERDIRDVEVVVFNTHGESMGRGGFPGTFEERLDHLMTPWARARFKKERISLNAESSFQGGDGFLHFQTPELALSTVTQIFTQMAACPEADYSDRFYRDINYSWDFYRGEKAWQEELFRNDDYHVTLAAFVSNLLFTTGSRKARRQSGAGAGAPGPRSLRAIPHNAILQQLAIPANVACGVGAGAGGELDRLVDLAGSSTRATRVLKLAEQARNATSLPAFRAYAGLYDATFWTARASMVDGAQAAAFRAIAERVKDQRVFSALSRLANFLADDLARFDEILKRIHGPEGRDERHDGRRALHVLHAIRQAIIMRAFALAASLPAFSGRHDITRADLLDLTLQLKLDEVVDLIRAIFPATQPEADALKAINEPVDEEAAHGGGYPEIQARIARPLEAIHQNIREIGVGVAHFYGAYG